MSKEIETNYLVIQTFHSSRDITQRISWMSKSELDDEVNCDHIINKEIKLISEDDNGILHYAYHETKKVKDSQDLRVHYLDAYIAIPEHHLYDNRLYLEKYIMSTNNKHGVLDTISGQASWAGHS